MTIVLGMLATSVVIALGSMLVLADALNSVAAVS